MIPHALGQRNEEVVDWQRDAVGWLGLKVNAAVDQGHHHARGQQVDDIGLQRHALFGGGHGERCMAPQELRHHRAVVSGQMLQHHKSGLGGQCQGREKAL